MNQSKIWSNLSLRSPPRRRRKKKTKGLGVIPPIMALKDS
jgi:hypothetical protein